MSDHGLDLGTLSLARGEVVPGCSIAVLGDGTAFGSSDPVLVTVQSLIADGEIVEHDSDSNVTSTIRVELTAPNIVVLNRGEARLRQELKKRNTLTWRPPRDFSGSATTVFPIITSWFDPEMDDLGEVRCRRVYVITLVREPHVRSAEPTVVAALPVGETLVERTISDCNSTAGWTGWGWGPNPSGGLMLQELGPAVSHDGGQAVAFLPGTVAQSGLDGVEAGLVFTGPMDLTGVQYIHAEVEIVNTKPTFIAAYLDGEGLPQVVQTSQTGGYRVTWRLPAGKTSASKLRISRTSWYQFYGAPNGIAVYDVKVSNRPPGVGPHQLTRVIPVEGTERTPGVINLQGWGSRGLGMTYVHTHPADEASGGYSPACRKWRVGGNETAATNDDSWSGAWEPMFPNAVVSHTPVSALPSGDYILAARLRSSTTGTFPIQWSVQTLFPPANAAEGQRSGTAHARFWWAGAPHFINIATPLRLPTVRTAGEGPVVRVSIFANTAGIEVDEWLLYRMGEDCALTVVGGMAPYLWLDAPDVDNPVARVSVGTQADRSDARFPGVDLIAKGRHIFAPGGVVVHTGTSGTPWATLQGHYYKRWSFNAPE